MKYSNFLLFLVSLAFFETIISLENKEETNIQKKGGEKVEGVNEEAKKYEEEVKEEEEEEYFVFESEKLNCTEFGIYDPPTNSCLCALDYTGETCSEKRSIDCNITLEYPDLDCKNYVDGDGDGSNLNSCLDTSPSRPCLIEKEKNKVLFGFKLSCKFSESRNQSEANFDYYVENGDQSFALSEEPDDADFYLQVYDLLNPYKKTNLLYQSGVWTQEKLLGEQVIEIGVDLSTYPDSLWTGGRLYTETQIGFEGCNNCQVFQQYIDVSGLLDIEKLQKTSPLNKAALIIPIVCLVLFIPLWIWKRKKVTKKRKPKTD
ncbi:hypothetical protein M0812_09869 [Anaeramoeba flamelloides]|uniref:EGF-like domain-containing protein n=1 Tax=Anaeramoeba flamelloides TaxID=1746091 RepID=A0AAV7ZRU1_9EUKA|nr:hypothetical protein M0812_09869 [Anaeramoeba flamelloides]